MALALAVAGGALAVSIAPAHPVSETAQMPPPRLLPEKIAMGAFYDGAHVRIEGTAPAASGVLIVIEGSERDEFFNRKGRVGPIWLTVDRIHVKHAPSMFLRFNSAALDSLLDPQEVEKYQLDEAAIMDRVRVFCHCKCSLTDRSQQNGIHDAVPDPTYARLLYADFLKLKQRQGRYREVTDAVKVVPDKSGTIYSLDFDWPKNIPPGSYQVTVYACHGHRVIAHSASTLQLVEVGFPAYMASLAFSSPWIYGIAAVLAAVAAGFLTDLFTSRLRRKRRTRREIEAPRPEPPTGLPEPPTTAHEETPAEAHATEITHH